MIIIAENPADEASKAPDGWVVYMLECNDGSLYTGITNNLENRVKTHNSGKGAKFTRAHRPVVLRYFEKVEDKSSALKREIAIKKLSRTQKLALIQRRSL